jgi:hypothetical protein
MLFEKWLLELVLMTGGGILTTQKQLTPRISHQRRNVTTFLPSSTS